MKPKPYKETAFDASPFLSPKQLEWLCDTDEFAYRTIFYPLIREDEFAGIYSDNKSRPATPPQVSFSLRHLKERYRLSYENVVQNHRFNQSWQLATGTLYMGGSIPGCEKTITRFEKSCADYAEKEGVPNPIDTTLNRFDVISCALGGIDGNLLRTDSTPISGNFTVRSREELLFLAIKTGYECVTCSVAPEQVAAVRSGRLVKYGDPNFTLNRMSDRWPASQDKRREMLCCDADALLEIYHKEKGLCKSKTIWELVINQQTKMNEQNIRVFAKKGEKQLNSTIIQSLLDSYATYRFKNGKPHWGYVLNTVEAASGMSHFIVSACLYPNNKTDAAMAEELNETITSFFEQVDAIYGHYPALKKGDPRHCQAVLQAVVDSLEKDFIIEGEKLYQMSLKGASHQELDKQLQRQMAVLDSFYDRLYNFDPDSVSPIIPKTAAPKPNLNEGGGEEKKAPCSKAIKDWSRTDENPIEMDALEFALLSDGERRNIILNKVAEQNEFGEVCFIGRNCAGDGAYSPATGSAKELGITMVTTNLLCRKGKSPIGILFNYEPVNGEKATCPLGHELKKVSYYKNGSVCVWVEKNDCENCPCKGECGAKGQKRGDLAKIMLNPHTFPTILTEALILTDKYQKFADFRNGSEALMSLFHNFYECDRWPIGMEVKRSLLRAVTTTVNIRNLVLFIRNKTRVHANPVVYGD